jgi:hypothetical protein
MIIQLLSKRVATVVTVAVALYSATAIPATLPATIIAAAPYSYTPVFAANAAYLAKHPALARRLAKEAAHVSRNY